MYSISERRGCKWREAIDTDPQHGGKRRSDVRERPLLGVRRLVGALAGGGSAPLHGLLGTRSRKAATYQSADKAAHSKEGPLATKA